MLTAALRAAWPGALFIAGLLGSGAIGWFVGEGEQSVRLAGMILQAGGLGTIALGIHNLRQQFRERSLPERLHGWVNTVTRAITGKGRVISGSMSITLDPATLTATGSAARLHVQHREPLQRIEALEREFQAFRQEFNQRLEGVHDSVRKQKDRLDAEWAERVADTEQVRKQMAEMAVGGLDLEIIGLGWLVAATVMLSVPLEIIRFVEP